MNYLLTRTEIKRLQDNGIEPYFNQTKNGYKRASTRKQDELVAEIAYRLYGERYTINWGCARCIFDLYHFVEKVHFESVDYYKNKDIEKSEEDGKNSRVQQTTSSTHRRRGRNAKGQGS